MIEKEKQIEEMASVMCGAYGDYCHRDGFQCRKDCRDSYLRAAARMYFAGYRKPEKAEQALKGGDPT